MGEGYVITANQSYGKNFCTTSYEHWPKHTAPIHFKVQMSIQWVYIHLLSHLWWKFYQVNLRLLSIRWLFQNYTCTLLPHRSVCKNKCNMQVEWYITSARSRRSKCISLPTLLTMLCISCVLSLWIIAWVLKLHNWHSSNLRQW